MKITIVTKNLGAGGAERVIAQLLKEWSKYDNCECSLILLEKGEEFYSIPCNVDIFRIGKKHKNKVVNKLLLYKEVRTLIGKINPDVVLSLPEEIGIYVIGALLGKKTKMVVSERNNPYLMPYKKVTRILRKILYPFADGFVFQTKQAAEFFSLSIQSKGIILCNPLDLSRIPTKKDGIYKKVVVSAGRLEKQKNFKMLIDAFCIFSRTHSDYSLCIYGEGSLRKELLEYAEHNISMERFILPGKNYDLLNDMIDCEMYVLSSSYEGSPNVLIEAMAAGMAVITTNYLPGGVDNIVTNERNGVIVSHDSPQEMADAMCRIADNPEIAARFRENAAKVTSKFDSVTVSKQWFEYLQNIVKH